MSTKVGDDKMNGISYHFLSILIKRSIKIKELDDIEDRKCFKRYFALDKTRKGRIADIDEKRRDIIHRHHFFSSQAHEMLCVSFRAIFPQKSVIEKWVDNIHSHSHALAARRTADALLTTTTTTTMTTDTQGRRR